MRTNNLLAWVVMLSTGLSSAARGETAEGPRNPARWFKGNTHCHTVLCGHADSTPEAVTEWYHDRGFNFLVLSEHNRYIDPRTVEMPWRLRDDFILIPGEEVTGHQNVHTTAFNIPELVGWGFRHAQRAHIVQHHTDAIVAAGGEPILNHPNFGSAIKVDDLLPVEGLHFFELYNGHPSVHNFGTAQNPSTEVLWDTLLTAGKVVYGISSDDAHHFQRWARSASNPGRGWTMVRAAALTPEAITMAMRQGDFYASSGVMLADVTITADSYTVSVDEDATARELTSEILYGRRVEEGRAGWRIELIGPGGEILETRHDVLLASFTRNVEHAYLRCKITFSRAGQTVREAPPPPGGTLPTGEVAAYHEEYYAWTQPAFADGRLQELHEVEPRMAPR